MTSTWGICAPHCPKTYKDVIHTVCPARQGARFGIAADRTATYLSDTEGTALNNEVISDAISQVRACAPHSANRNERINADRKKRGRQAISLSDGFTPHPIGCGVFTASNDSILYFLMEKCTKSTVSNHKNSEIIQPIC